MLPPQCADPERPLWGRADAWESQRWVSGNGQWGQEGRASLVQACALCRWGEAGPRGRWASETGAIHSGGMSASFWGVVALRM